MTEKVIDLFEWKGKDTIEIFRGINIFIVREHRKVKETGEIDYIEHKIPIENVRTLLQIIKNKCQPNIEYSYKYLVRAILEHYKFHEKEGLTIEQMMEAFNGGKNRAKYYFPFLYYSLKCLEMLGKIEYFGRGGIRLK